MKQIQRELNHLLEKYCIHNTVELSEDLSSVTVNGETYALLPWRRERRFTELKKIVDSHTIGNISHFKIMSLNPISQDLKSILQRELDIAEFIGGFCITEIFMTRNQNTCSVLCKTNSDALVTLELSATLQKDNAVIDKHEIITDRGTACDRNVDSQTPLSSVYVYSNKSREYADVDFELYGLSPYEVSIVRSAFAIVKDADKAGKSNNEIAARLDDIYKKAELSEQKCVNVLL